MALLLNKPIEPEKQKGIVSFRYRAPWYGGDLQTIRNELLRPRRPSAMRSSVMEFPTSDGSGDRLSGTLTHTLGSSSGPLILLIHGFTGSEESAYIRETERFHLARGRAVLRVSLRGAGKSKSTGRYYHAGSSSDIEDILKKLFSDKVASSIFAIGFSLGGNILLNLLGRLANDDRLRGAAVVSAPIKLAQACRRLMERRNYFYHRALLSRIKREVLTLEALTVSERKTIADARSLFEFDDAWVAPKNKFDGARDYYSRTSSFQHVEEIRIPTLMLHACDDPWIPVEPYFELQQRNMFSVKVLIAGGGGHVGFHEHGFRETWHDRMIDEFLSALVHPSGAGK